jgi:hypothetical protein
MEQPERNQLVSGKRFARDLESFRYAALMDGDHSGPARIGSMKRFARDPDGMSYGALEGTTVRGGRSGLISTRSEKRFARDHEGSKGSQPLKLRAGIAGVSV